MFLGRTLQQPQNDSSNGKEFIPEDRSVKLLSEVEILMPEKFKTENKFVELLIGINKENVERIFTELTKRTLKER